MYTSTLSCIKKHTQCPEMQVFHSAALLFLLYNYIWSLLVNTRVAPLCAGGSGFLHRHWRHPFLQVGHCACLVIGTCGDRQVYQYNHVGCPSFIDS